MKVVVIGGSGLIGSQVVTRLNEHGHDASPASLETGLNVLTNEGVEDAVTGAEVLIDVSNSRSFEDAAVAAAVARVSTGQGARLGATRFEDWLEQSMVTS